MPDKLLAAADEVIELPLLLRLIQGRLWHIWDMSGLLARADEVIE